ncbi:Alpha-L-rhamnosidase [Drechslerella dactyloides]|uniref:alpha-L-rhamnosidase n=1 Tax=Drechslerella dactyloides TaxID=74499 RepID=A0AAD6NH14_DREDA|nr:Alpha-L-rhamnosidase [Drechslerella dactyloides]
MSPVSDGGSLECPETFDLKTSEKTSSAATSDSVDIPRRAKSDIGQSLFSLSPPEELGGQPKSEGWPPLEIANLRLAQTSNLLGVDIPTPAISWAYSIPSTRQQQSWCQQTYILRLRNWPLSGGVNASASAGSYTIVGPKTHRTENIPWPKAFPPIRSSYQYELSVEALLAECGSPGDHWDFGTPDGDSLVASEASSASLKEKIVGSGYGSDAITAPSKLSFEAGIIGGIDAWRKNVPAVKMITTPWDLESWEISKPVTLLKNTYNFKSKPWAARIHATAFGIYKIVINGKQVGDSIMEPQWTEYKERVLYQTYDVTDLLQRGENDVVVHVADGWYRGRMGPTVKDLVTVRGFFGNETGFLAIFDTYGSEGGKARKTFWTGPTNETGWKCTRSTPIVGSGIYDGEHYDARIDFNTVDEKDQSDNGWQSVKVIPYAFAAGSSQKLQASIAPPIQCTEKLPVKAYLKSPDGKTIVDFGQNIAGRLRLRGTAPAGTKITLVHVEVLKPDGTPNTSILRDAKCTDSYTFRGSGANRSNIEEWEPDFTFHGFRYVQVHPWIEGLELEAKVYGSNLPRVLSGFQSTNKELNRLAENIEWSARANFFAVPTDCPQRDERLGWTGDINLFSPTAVYIFDCQTFLESYLSGVKDSMKIGGLHSAPIISPNVFRNITRSHSARAVWSDVLVTLPWTLYQAYGDTNLLRDLYPSMVDYHTNGIPKILDGEFAGLWRDVAQYGDWLNPSSPPDQPAQLGTDTTFVADTWLCRITDALAGVATALQLPEDAKEWSSNAAKVKALWRSKYFLPPGNSTSGEPPKILNQDTQTAYSTALEYNILPEEYIKPAIARLHYLVRSQNYHPTTGLVGGASILHAVSHPRTLPSSKATLGDKLGSVALAYKLLLGRRDFPSWLYPITMGATSIWERWDSIKPDGTSKTDWMTSLNHYALGAVGRWIYENVGGITIDMGRDSKGGYTGAWKFIFDPIPSVEHGITSSNMEFKSPKGVVGCKWSYDQVKKTMSIEVAVPGNSEGEIRVVGRTVKKVGAGRWSVKTKLEEEEWKLLEAGEGEQGHNKPSQRQ